jgi:hypothetical protein
MILTLSRALVSIAARRWPDRSQMRQEWLAELDYLAAHRGPLRVFSFGAGLVFARPAQAPAIGLTWRTLGTVLFLLGGPFMLVVLCKTTLYLLIQMARIAPNMSSPIATSGVLAVLVAAAYLFGRWWGNRSVLIGPTILALGVGLSVGASVLALPRVLGAYSMYLDHLRAGTVWAPVLVLMIFLVARSAQRGWGGRAMLAATVVWLAVIDLAIMYMFWPNLDYKPVEGYVFHADHAPLWGVSALTGSSHGVLNREEVAQIQDDAVFLPQTLIIFAIYAISYAVAAVRSYRSQAVSAA